MEPGPLVIGVNYRTAPIEVRERFRMDGIARSEALARLALADGIEEAVVLSTAHRTEFWLWASDPSMAANSVLRLLADVYHLHLCEWRNFYRLVEEAAVRHILELTCGEDAEAIAELGISSVVEAAGKEAARLGAAGCFLDSLILEALNLAKSLHPDSSGALLREAIRIAVDRSFNGAAQSIPVVLGSGNIASVLVGCFPSARDTGCEMMAQNSGNGFRSFMQVRGALSEVEDICSGLGPAKEAVVICTDGDQLILTQSEVERIQRKRRHALLLILDLSCPRKVAPAAASIPGVSLLNLDGLCRMVRRKQGQFAAIGSGSDEVFTRQASAVYRKLVRNLELPTSALRAQVFDTCKRELVAFEEPNGCCTTDREKLLVALAARITKRVAAMLALDLQGRGLVRSEPPVPILAGALRMESTPVAFLHRKNSQRRSQ